MMTTIPFRPGRDRGFTLIELMFTLVLLGILASLAAPKMSGFMDRTRVDSVLNELTGGIAHARMLAVRTGQGADLIIQAGGTSYRVVPGGGTGGTVTTDLTRDYPGLQLEVVDPLALPLTLSFNSRGLLRRAGEDQAGVVRVRKDTQSGTLRILPTGRAFREN